MPDRVRLSIDGPEAVITNDNTDKHDAFDDEMDQRLFEILAELRERREVRAVVWRARFISGHTLVVDGANWQRRSLTNPEVVPVRDQMGRPPFDV